MQNETAYHAVDGHAMNDRGHGKKKPGKDKTKVDLDNLKREMEMVGYQFHHSLLIYSSTDRNIKLHES